MNSSASAAMNSSRTATIGNGYVREDVDDVQHAVNASTCGLCGAGTCFCVRARARAFLHKCLRA